MSITADLFYRQILKQELQDSITTKCSKSFIPDRLRQTITESEMVVCIHFGSRIMFEIKFTFVTFSSQDRENDQRVFTVCLIERFILISLNSCEILYNFSCRYFWILPLLFLPKGRKSQISWKTRGDIRFFSLIGRKKSDIVEN